MLLIKMFRCSSQFLPSLCNKIIFETHYSQITNTFPNSIKRNFWQFKTNWPQPVVWGFVWRLQLHWLHCCNKINIITLNVTTKSWQVMKLVQITTDEIQISYRSKTCGHKYFCLSARSNIHFLKYCFCNTCLFWVWMPVS